MKYAAHCKRARAKWRTGVSRSAINIKLNGNGKHNIGVQLAVRGVRGMPDDGRFSSTCGFYGLAQGGRAGGQEVGAQFSLFGASNNGLFDTMATDSLGFNYVSKHTLQPGPVVSFGARLGCLKAHGATLALRASGEVSRSGLWPAPPLPVCMQ